MKGSGLKKIWQGVNKRRDSKQFRLFGFPDPLPAFLFILLFLCGCSTTKINIDNNNYNGIGNHPYQAVGMYEVNEEGYVKRIILNKGRVKKINNDKYYYEIIIKTGE